MNNRNFRSLKLNGNKLFKIIHNKNEEIYHLRLSESDIDIGIHIDKFLTLSELKTLPILSLTFDDVFFDFEGRPMSYPKSFDLSALAELDNLCYLDINYSKLTNIDSLCKLTNLRRLYIKNAQIINIDFLKNLPNLEELAIIKCSLKGSISIVGLEKLKIIDLSNNNINNLDILNLVEATNINISNNNISNLELDNLPKLKNINFSDNPIKKITIKRLNVLKELDLSNGIIERIEIENTPNLKNLNLKNNRISELNFLQNVQSLNFLNIQLNPLSNYEPLKHLLLIEILSIDSLNSTFTRVGKLIYLKEIYISGFVEKKSLIDYLSNKYYFPSLVTMGYKSPEIYKIERLVKVTMLPSFPGDIQSLINNETFSLNNKGQIVAIRIRRKKIKNISFLKNLKKLEILDLRINKIKDIRIIQGLPELRELHLYGNEISNIPNDFFESLPNLKYLNIRNNPLKNVPKEIFDIDKNVLNEVKTYLNSLQGEREYLHQAKLILIGNGEVGKSSIKLKLLDKDSALPKKDERTQGLDIASYLVKYIPSSLTNIEIPIDFTLSIWDFGGQGRYREVQQLFCSRKALYLFVTSFDDQPTKEDYIGFEYWLSMAKAYGYDRAENWESPIIHVVNKSDLGNLPINEIALTRNFNSIHEFVKISCETLKNFDKLEEYIRTALPKVSKDIFTNQFSKKWFQVKNDLDELKSNNHISLQKYKEICDGHGLKEVEGLLWLDYLDRIGSVIYFREHLILNQFLVLNPLWVKDSMYKVLDSNLIQKGLLYKTHFAIIWKEYSAYEHDNLLSIMLAYKFCYAHLDVFGDTYYIIPALLPNSKPEFPSHLKKVDFELKFDYFPFLPAGTVNKLIVELNKHIYQDLKWKNGCVFHLIEGDRISFAEVIEEWNEKVVFLRISGNNLHNIYILIKRALANLLQDLKKIKFLDNLDMEVKVKVDGDYEYPKTIVKFGLEKEYSFLFNDSTTNKTSSKMKTIKIFLASSSELKNDRDEVRAFISVLNDSLHEKDIYLQLVQWEYFSDAMSNTRLQDEYNKAIETCDLVLSLFFTKAGKYTVEEFNHAYEIFRNFGKPLVFTYFKDAPVNAASIDDSFVSLIEFKKYIINLGHFPTTYKNIDDLKVQFKRQLDNVLKSI